MSSTKIFTVDKFLGLNEAADGETELKMGQASKMENWLITDGYNLTVRPGFQRVDTPSGNWTQGMSLAAIWSGTLEGKEYLVAVALDGVYDGDDTSHAPTDCILMYTKDEGGKFHHVSTQRKALGIWRHDDHPVKIFSFGGRLYIMSGKNTVVYRDGEFVTEEPYVPLVITGANPAGGGTMLENLNLLTPLRRMEFSADGEATAYVLPEEATAVTAITVDNEGQDVGTAGSFDAQSHTYTFAAAPAKGVGNVEFTYTTDSAAAEENRLRIVDMTLVEAFNGSTDTRLFMAGDGSNVCCYSGTPSFGNTTGLYFPAMNEVVVDMASSPVTGLVRHYTKLLVYTRNDGVYTITYEPVTLADGTVTAGFYLRPVHREFGNEPMGQIQTVGNFPRTISGGSVYEWRITSSYYKDERYAKRVSDPVEKSLKKADPKKIVTCDDNYEKTYYVFLNDEEGTVLVNRYGLGNEGGLWCMYKSGRCKNVRYALMCGDTMVFGTTNDLFYLDRTSTRDTGSTFTQEDAIKAVWESGYMDFGAPFLRKYSSKIYVSALPEASSWLTITAATDRRDTYTEKAITGGNPFDFGKVNFARWCFNMDQIPKINRLRLKVRRFVYYKLIFTVEGMGDRATILSFNQQVHFGGRVR